MCSYNAHSGFVDVTRFSNLKLLHEACKIFNDWFQYIFLGLQDSQMSLFLINVQLILYLGRDIGLRLSLNPLFWLLSHRINCLVINLYGHCLSGINGC